LLVEKGRVRPIVATIGMMWVVSGLAGGISNGRLIPILDESFQQIALGSAFEIVPLFFVGLLIIGAIAYFVRSNFAIGRYVYVIGGDEGAAYYSAIPVAKIRIGVYGVAGVLYGVVGLLMASYVRSGMPVVGKGYEFKAITAAVLGGIALTGRTRKYLQSDCWRCDLDCTLRIDYGVCGFSLHSGDYPRLHSRWSSVLCNSQ
jgi:ribose/xylose/arabinose/galactoside ABC-type transport system permease subunit